VCGCRSESVLADIILSGDTDSYALSGSQLHNFRLLRKTTQDKARLKLFLNREYQKSRQDYLKINLDLARSVAGSSHISMEQEGINIFSLWVGRQVATLPSMPASTAQRGRR